MGRMTAELEEDDDAWFERQQRRMKRLMQQRTVYVVPCGADKLDRPARARELYIGSMFKTALRSAEALGDGEIIILSALHGLLDPDDWVEPYNMKMGDKGSVSPATVREQAHNRFGWRSPMNVHTFLPKKYFAVLDKALKPLGIYAQDIYEADPGIGYQRGTCKVIRDSVKCTVAALEASAKVLEVSVTLDKKTRSEVVASLRAAADVLAGKLDPSKDKKLIDFMAKSVVELHQMGGEDLPKNDRGWADLLDEIAEIDDSREWNKIWEKYDEEGLDLKPAVPAVKQAVQKLLKGSAR